jgi:hypothetical protein
MPDSPLPRKSKPVSSERKDQHWYEILPDGRIEARFAASLRDARNDLKVGGRGFFPSPTTVIGSILAKPELEAWKVSTAMDGIILLLGSRAASLEPPARQPGEDDGAYLKRSLAIFLPQMEDDAFRREALDLGRAKVKVAQGFGVEVHEAVDSYLKHGAKGATRISKKARPFFEQLKEWIDGNVSKVFYSERRMASEIGVAGTSDLGLMLKTGERVVADIKTGGWGGAPGARKPYRKIAHGLQVSSYRKCAEESLDPEWANAGGLILHLCREEALPVIAEPYSQTQMDEFYRAFKGLLDTWVCQNSYRPRTAMLRGSPGARDSTELKVATEQAKELEGAGEVSEPAVAR